MFLLHLGSLRRWISWSSSFSLVHGARYNLAGVFVKNVYIRVICLLVYLEITTITAVIVLT